jgi:hypothetical protein
LTRTAACKDGVDGTSEVAGAGVEEFSEDVLELGFGAEVDDTAFSEFGAECMSE